MSPTRKPKPPDKGAPPEHKPSRKVALEEVMRSLQDLVSNELATEPVQQPATTATPPKPRAITKKTAASTAAPQPTEEASTETTPEDESITLEGLPDYDVTPPPLEPKPATTKPKPPAGGPSTTLRTGLQQELPYLDTMPPLPVASTPGAVAETRTQAMEKLPTADSITLDAPPADTFTGNHARSAIAPLSVTETTPAPTDEINWDDIPVLEEAVDMSEEFYAQETSPAQDAAAPLPPAEAARRLAVQVAARLNVELRKSGQGGLSSDIITRLARLLQEALAKGASNMENTTVNKASYTDGGSAGNAGAVFRPTPDKH